MKRALVSALATSALCAALAATASAQTTRTIVIDPGHGGSDPGGVGNGLQEKNIVLDVGNRFKRLLDADTADTGGGGRWVALMTRSTDVFVSLSARSSFANSRGADRFMSIHSNAFSNPQANGTETFAFAEGGQGAALRNLVQAEMLAAWGLTNRGNKVANFAVLRETAMPAELHELAFITNARDAAKLGSATERQKAAVAHLRAIQRHFGIAPFLPRSAAAEDRVPGSPEGEGTETPPGDEEGDESENGQEGGEEAPESADLGNDSGCAGAGLDSQSGGLGAALSLLAIAALVGARRGRLTFARRRDR